MIRIHAALLMVLLSCTVLLVTAGCKASTANRRSNRGYVQIFDGKTLNGWSGDSLYWRVEDGCLVGEVTPATILKRNTFIVWQQGLTTDFSLKVDYRITPGGNSGINYRSVAVVDVPFALKGYQADIDGANNHTGQNYEERGRTFLALRGQAVILEPGKKPLVKEKLGDIDSLKAVIRPDWNEYHLVVRGNRLQHFVNGVLMSDVTDNDTTARTFTGLLGVQVHVGPPMKVFFKNFRLKQL